MHTYVLHTVSKNFANLANHNNLPKFFPPIFKTLSSVCGHLLCNKLYHHTLQKKFPSNMSHYMTLSGNRLLMATACVFLRVPNFMLANELMHRPQKDFPKYHSSPGPSSKPQSSMTYQHVKKHVSAN